MTRMIPFPASLAAVSAATGRRLQVSDVDDAGRRRPKSALPAPYTARGVAAFSWPDGRIGVTHDMYRPMHPEGSLPGIADIRYDVQHYANDTSGYVPRILRFRSIEELSWPTGPIDLTAAGMVRTGQAAFLVIQSDEAAMERLWESLPEGSDLIRAPITQVDIDVEHLALARSHPPALEQFLMTWTRGNGLEIMAAATEDGLHAAARKRFEFLPETADLDEFRHEILKHGMKHGWVVAAVSREEIEARTPQLIEDLKVLAAEDSPSP